MQKPNTSEVRGWTPKVPWPELGYGVPHAGADPLDLEVALAVAYVEWVIEMPLEAVPPTMEAIAQKAVVLRVIQQVNVDSEEQQEASFAGDVLKSFNVTGYSETYVEPGEAQQAQRKGMMINPWAELNRLLWALVSLTPKRLGWWRAFLSEGGIPAYGVVEMDWSGANRFGGFPAGAAAGGLPGDYLGWDGLGDGWGGVGGWPSGSNMGVIIPEGFMG